MAQESGRSNDVTLTPAATPAAPAIPQNLTGVAGNQQVTLTWQAAANATGYKVYQRGVGDTPSEAVVVAVVTTLTATITGLVNGSALIFYVTSTN
jgi:hypothetical protein